MNLIESRSERQRRHYRRPETEPCGRAVAGLGSLLVQTVTRVFDVEMDLVRRPTRGRAHVVLARQVAMYLAHVGCGLSLSETGELFNRDRTTVAHGCHAVEVRRDDPGFDRAMELMERVITVFLWPREAAWRACAWVRHDSQSVLARSTRA